MSRAEQPLRLVRAATRSYFEVLRHEAEMGRTMTALGRLAHRAASALPTCFRRRPCRLPLLKYSLKPLHIPVVLVERRANTCEPSLRLTKYRSRRRPDGAASSDACPAPRSGPGGRPAYRYVLYGESNCRSSRRRLPSYVPRSRARRSRSDRTAAPCRILSRLRRPPRRSAARPACRSPSRRSTPASRAGASSARVAAAAARRPGVSTCVKAVDHALRRAVVASVPRGSA